MRMMWRASVSTGAVYAPPLGLALEIPTLVEQRKALGGDWASTMEVANGSAILLAIAAAVGACLITTRWADTQTLAVTMTRRHWWGNVVPAALVAVPLLVVHTAWVLGIVALDKIGGLSGGPSIIVLVPVWAAIVACALVGSLVGGVARSYVAGPVLGIALYVALINRGPVIGPMFSLGGIGSRLLGLEVRPEMVWTQSAWWAAVAAAALLISAAGPRRVLARSAMLLIGAVVLLMPTRVAATMPSDRFQLRDPLTWTCVGEEPRLCALDGAEPSAFGSLRDRFAEADRRWAESVGTPTVHTYWQRLELPVPGHAEEVRVAGHMSDSHVIFEVIVAAHDCSDSWTYQQFQVVEDAVRRLEGSGLQAPWQPEQIDTSPFRCQE